MDALAPTVVMVNGIMWLSGRVGSCLPSHHTPGPEKAISWGGGWVVFGVPVSLHQHQKEMSMPCMSVWVCKCVYSPSPPPTLCLWGCWGEREREVERCHSNSVTAYWSYSGGEWPSREMRCVFDRHERCVMRRPRFHSGLQSSTSRTQEHSAWFGSSSLSSWSRKPARLMFIHYHPAASSTRGVLGGPVALMMFQMAQWWRALQ